MAESNSAQGRWLHDETLPEKLLGPGRLHLWPPLGNTLAKVYRHLQDGDWVCEVARNRSVVVRLDEDHLNDLFMALSEALTNREMEDTRALFKPGADGLSVDDIPKARSLRQLSTLGQSGWLLDMLSEGRLTSHFQPIVRADDPVEVFARECLVRGIEADGSLVPASVILTAAKECGVLFQADLAARLAAIREAVRHGVKSNLFINVTPTFVYDPEFCLRSTVEAIDEAGLDHKKIIFEITETEVGHVDHLKDIVGCCREMEFRVALDDLGSGSSSLNLVHRLRPDFVKLDVQLIRGVHADPYKAVVTQKVLEMAQELGVKTIVEGVETHEELNWTRDRGANFAQGYLFGGPSALP